MLIATAGKGSAGKTLIAASVLGALTMEPRRILVVDADVHESLVEVLGQGPVTSVGSLRSALEAQLATLAWDESRVEALEAGMGELVLAKRVGYDLLAMGHWAPPGSQCTVNRSLDRSLAALMGRYDLVLVDHEAGMEQMGRYSALPIDRLLLVVQPEVSFVRVASRILDRAREVRRPILGCTVILNRVTDAKRSRPEFRDALDALMRSRPMTLIDVPELDGSEAEPRDPRLMAALAPVVTDLERSARPRMKEASRV